MVTSIVYLPRIRYEGRPNVQRCVSNLGHTRRRLHSVVPHLRRLANGWQASDHQRTLATLHGFHCDEGYTFVAAHQRGRDKQDVIYRSRSALNSLYAVTAENTATGDTDRWFQFERDVHRVLVAMGLNVEHIAASRHGDRGIEIYATQGRDLDQANWIIHCECRHPKRAISAKVIRELADVLAGYPHGTRGMVLTTSRFSAGAIEAATVANIRLVDGEEFRQLVESVVGTAPPYTNRLAG